MSDPPGQEHSPDDARTFRRSTGIRFLSVACAALFVGVAVSVMLESGLTAGAVVLAVLALLSLFNLAGAYADRYTIGESGIRYENRILTRLGKRPRHLAWADIGRVREHRRLNFGRAEAQPTAIFLFPRAGRRLVLDSLDRFDEVLQAIRRRCPPESPVDGGGETPQ